jgi:hypothetical protein
VRFRAAALPISNCYSTPARSSICHAVFLSLVTLSTFTLSIFYVFSGLLLSRYSLSEPREPLVHLHVRAASFAPAGIGMHSAVILRCQCPNDPVGADPDVRVHTHPMCSTSLHTQGPSTLVLYCRAHVFHCYLSLDFLLQSSTQSFFQSTISD